MKAVFNDMQDYSSHLNEAVVHNRAELFALLASVRDRQPFGCELIGQNDFKLTLGVGQNVGFVQHSAVNGDAPYLLAVAPGKCCEQAYVEFLIGNTPTTVPQQFCLPFQTVKEIAAYFLETGERSPLVAWEDA
jgi:hypothetical protein